MDIWHALQWFTGAAKPIHINETTLLDDPCVGCMLFLSSHAMKCYTHSELAVLSFMTGLGKSKPLLNVIAK